MAGWFAGAARGALGVEPRDAERLRRYRRFQDWYDGQQWPSASGRAGRSSLTLNYARAIVDKGVAFLLGRGLGFAVLPADETDPASRERARRAEQLIYEVYWDNDLDAIDIQVATNAAVLGDGVYKVFYDAAARRIRVVNVDPFTFSVCWAGDDPGALTRVEVAYSLEAAEAERLYGRGTEDEGRRTEEERSPSVLRPSSSVPRSPSSVTVQEQWTAETFQVSVDQRVVRSGRNPYGFIPFVHVPNMQPPNQLWGRSDLDGLIEINRELNERMSDQADVIRYHADPPVIFRGVTEHTDLAVGPGTVWDIPLDSDVKLLEWQGQSPSVQEHIERVMRTLFEVSETPRSAFGDSGRLLSGVALEMELRPIIQKTLRRRAFWTRALRQRNALILKLAERFEVDGARPGDFAPYRTKIVWPPMVPADDTALVRQNIALVEAGLRSYRGALDALGEENPEAELERIRADQAALLRWTEDDGRRTKE
ncbi:MAG: phage portal protein, partial [Chloroflexota bacterium]